MILFTEMSSKGANCLTDSLFFDNDCISAFLWVREESLLDKLYSGKIVIPQEVYTELSHPHTQQLKQRVDQMIASGSAELAQISVDSEEYKTYSKLALDSSSGNKLIGKGEAACIAMAKEQGGVLASNNLRDIMTYVTEYGLTHITTGDILHKALEEGLITQAEGEVIWGNMLAKRRKLGFSSFSDYITSKG